MTNEPRDPALAALARATVRVGKGSGVVFRGPAAPLIATAAHVITEGETPIVRKAGMFGEAHVLRQDPELDLALLAPAREFDGLALSLVDDENAGRPGDPIWAAGFPDGWTGTHPVLAPGTIAGVGEENWVNLDGTWGNSGGPLCRVVGSSVEIVGVLRGKAGDVKRALRDLRASATRSQLEVQELEESIPLANADARLQLQGIMANAALARELADLLEQHFRTGFLRFATVAEVRKLL